MNKTLNIVEANTLLNNRNKCEKDFPLFHTLREIEESIKKNGDAALLEYTQKFDGIFLQNLFATQEEIQNATIEPELENAIKVAYNNIKKFHEEQFKSLQNQPIVETMQGVKCWRKFTPIEKVGLYVPAGTAPLFSTVLMTALPAQIAQCREIILATPPQKDGTIHPAILFTARLCGVKQILKVGGAQAIFAMAYGTQSVPKVYKIFGPGNKFVDGAKQMVQNTVAIDMPAGPSEVMVVCDNASNPQAVASDVLSQLEHDATASAILVCNSQKHIDAVNNCILARIQIAPRRQIIQKSLQNYHALLVENIADAVPFINEYAPEHLIINTQNYNELAEKIINAGSVFLGKYAAETIGDYASGTNHTLPTNGFAKAFSGLSVESFGKFVTFQEVDAAGFKNIAGVVSTMAKTEGLFEHANAVEVRNI
ncbi:MAG: histidinol dehydrogenase [Proteobacteria bacterium]|nr:histidinol dehydrogenase [Pseudomonadota bacterium]